MKYVIANTKQNMTSMDIDLWCKEFIQLISSINLSYVTPIFCPSFPFLEKASRLLSPHGISVGAQDVSEYKVGAYTGNVGALQINECCKYTLVGHSERREDRLMVMKKADNAIKNGITPIICYKSRSDYERLDGAIYALEDPENISSNGVYNPKPIEEITKLISDARAFFNSGPKSSIIIYGGSVNSTNVDVLAKISDLDGVLVGNASLNPHEFADIVKRFSL